MAKILDEGVAEKTDILEKTVAGTRVLLGFAVGMGFVASAMAFFMIADDIGGGGGGDTGLPLKVAQVTNVKSIMDQADQFAATNYIGGSTTLYQQTGVLEGSAKTALTSNQVLKIQTGTTTNTIGNTNGGPTTFSIESIGGNSNSGGGATTFSIESIGGNTNSGGGATTFSIESIGATTFSISPIAQSGTPGQMAVMEYRLATDASTTPTRKLTLCIGHTSLTTLYVGTDGSTYGNMSFGMLNGRTTNESCATIKQRAMKTTRITGGSIVEQGGNYAQGDYVFIRAFMYVARFHDGQFVQDSAQPITLETEAPLTAGFSFTSTPNKPAPPAIITLNEQTNGDPIHKTVCFPETTMNPLTGGPGYYFDSQGTPFTDIFLQNRAITVSCGDVQAKALKYNLLNGSTTISLGGQMDLAAKAYISRSNGTLGTIENGAFMTDPGNGVTRPNDDPTLITVVPPSPTIGTTYKLPQTIATLVGTTAVAAGETRTTICVPELTFTRTGDAVNSTYTVDRAYFDTTGNAYKDIFLTQRWMTTNCADILTKGYAPTRITTATMTPSFSANHGIWVSSGSYLYGVIDQNGWNDRQGQQGTNQHLPLVLALTGSNDAVTIPYVEVAITDDTGSTKTVCWGGWSNATALSRSTAVFYDKDGKGYTDMFMTKPYACPSAYQNVRVISKTATSVVIGWDTPRTTCSNINYGTVVNQLNSGPVAETAPCTGTSHRATISGLTAGKTYLYEIVGGGPKVSGQQTFTTLSSGGGSGPKKSIVSEPTN